MSVAVGMMMPETIGGGLADRQAPSRSRLRRGFTLVDAIISLGIVGLMMADFARIEANITLNNAAQAAGQQVAAVGIASQTYMEKNNIKLKTLIPVGSSMEIPITGAPAWNGIGDLQFGGGLLGSNFANILPNGQTMHFVARHVPANGTIPDYISTMILTSGPMMKDAQLGVAVNSMRGPGGAIMQRPPFLAPANSIVGAFGNWQEPFANWASSGVPLSAGHLAYNMNSIGSPISDYLNRYDTGNAESNRMHTSIDFNSNNANNMNNLDVQEINNTRADHVQFATQLSGDASLITGATNNVRLVNGIRGCESNVTGCGIQISDDGGFFDQNDGWITMLTAQGNTGLNLANGNLKVGGYGQFASYGQFGGNVGTRNYSANSGYPSGWGGGVHTLDVYAEGSVGVGTGGQRWVVLNGGGIGVSTDGSGSNNAAYINNAGNGYLAGHFGTNGFSPTDGIPSSWIGGIHTLDVYSEGTIGVGQGGTLDAYINKGGAMISGYAQAGILRPAYVAVANTACNITINGTFGSRSPVTVQNGDIARDNYGNTLSCSNGVWRNTAAPYSIPIAHGCLGGYGAGTNSDSVPHMFVFEIIGGHHGPTGSVVTVNGSEVGTVSSTIDEGRISGTVTAVVPAGQGWTAGGGANIDNVCYTEFK